MKTIDRLQAVRHSAKYKRDYDKYLEALKPEEVDCFSYSDGLGIIYSRVTTPGIELCRKYKIPIPIKPIAYDLQDADMPEWVTKARLKARGEGVYGQDDISNVKELPGVNIVPQQRGDGATGWGPDEDTHQLAVTIDMEQPFERIKADLKKIYEYFDSQNNFRSKGKRQRDSGPINQGIWHVYKIVKEHGDNCYAAAQELGMMEKPSDDKTSQSLYRQVDRAYKKAQELIQEVERQIS